MWSPTNDRFRFKVKLDLSKKNRQITQTSADELPAALTKRSILSQINRIYDPLGLATSYTVRAKILMRKLWSGNTKLDWDDPLPNDLVTDWNTFFKELPKMELETFNGCIKPLNAIGDPILIIFSDGSENAYGACAYVRWKLSNGTFESRMVISKNRLSPLKKMSIDRIELCGAVLSKRLKVFLDKESRYNFAKYYHIVDSQIVCGMIQKDSYGFNTFAATRIGEIQEGTKREDWYWTESKNNIVDWITRGRKPQEIGQESIWQTGPNFLIQPENKWPIKQLTYKRELPERIKTVMTTQGMENDSLEQRINIHKYSNYNKLIRATARILALYKRKPKPSFKNVVTQPTAEEIAEAERFWILRSQSTMTDDFKKRTCKRLCSRVRQDGIVVIGNRAEKWLEMSYNKTEVILLQYGHPFSKLYAEFIHRNGHNGVSATVSKIRARFWITHLHRMVKSIVHNCVICKIPNTELSQQVMGNIPEERLKPSPAWHNTAIDLFGPFKIRDEIKKRTFGKCYRMIFNCMNTRAVHMDLVSDCSTEKFLLALRRFISLIGYPA